MKMNNIPRFIPIWLLILTIVILLYFLTGCAVYHAPNGKAFPRGWGKPPEIQTADHIPLPYGYGYGSSTLYGWISKNKGYQSPSGKPFPRSWGKPPAAQTKDYRPLPYGYGCGSSTLYNWIMENKK